MEGIRKMAEEMVCGECKFPIAVHQKYMKHDRTGRILCVDCFKKLRNEGKIK